MGSSWSRAKALLYGAGHGTQINSVTYGTYFRSEYFSSWLRGVVLLVVPMLLALVQIVCMVIDIERWHGSRLCSKERTCATIEPSNAETKDLCTELDGMISTLFTIYNFALPATITKLTVVLVLVMSHRSLNMPTAATFDVRTLERSVAGVVFWVTTALLDVAVTVMAVYRFMVVASQEPDYADILYASDGPATTTGLLLVGMGSCLASIGISVTVTVLRCQQLADKLAEFDRARPLNSSNSFFAFAYHDLHTALLTTKKEALCEQDGTTTERLRLIPDKQQNSTTAVPLGIFEIEEADRLPVNPTPDEFDYFGAEWEISEDQGL